MLRKEPHNHAKYTNTWHGYFNSSKLKNSKWKPIIQPDYSPKKSSPSWNYVHKMYQNRINKMKPKNSQWDSIIDPFKELVFPKKVGPPNIS